MKRKTALLVVILMVIPLVALAGGSNRAGTSSAQGLTIPVGARYLGFSGSGVAIANGLEAVYWNPAGVALAKRDVNAMFSYRKYIADINVNFVSISSRFGFGTIALSLRTFDLGDIDVTTEAAPDGTGEILSPNYFVVGATYSKELSARTAIGVTFNIINESFARVSASGISFDIGVQYRNMIGIERLTSGVAVKNIGPEMTYGGPGLLRQADVPLSQRGVTPLKVDAASFDLPSVFELGLAYSYPMGETGNLAFSSTYQNNNYAVDEWRIGVEYSYDDQFFLRGGYLFSSDPLDVPETETDHIFRDFSLGFGLNFAQVGGLGIELDYAYVPTKIFEDNHVISVNLGF